MIKKAGFRTCGLKIARIPSSQIATLSSQNTMDWTLFAENSPISVLPSMAWTMELEYPSRIFAKYQNTPHAMKQNEQKNTPAPFVNVLFSRTNP